MGGPWDTCDRLYRAPTLLVATLSNPSSVVHPKQSLAVVTTFVTGDEEGVSKIRPSEPSLLDLCLLNKVAAKQDGNKNSLLVSDYRSFMI